MTPKERDAIRFLIKHLVLGACGGFAFAIGLLAFDVASMRTLMWSSEDTVLWLILLFFGMFVTFGSVGMGVGVMSLAEDGS